MYYVETLENYNAFWQGDYASARFAFIPPGNVPFQNKDVYVFLAH